MKKFVFWIASLLIMQANDGVAYSASFTLNGNLPFHNDVVKIGFSLAHDSNDVKIWTDSFKDIGGLVGTNFDPLITVWDAKTGDWIDENDDDDTIASGQTQYDAGLALNKMLAGDYVVTLTASDNFGTGFNLADGFNYDADTPILIKDWPQPSNEANLRGNFWQINIKDVDSAALIHPAAVPLPGAVWLFGSALVLVFGYTKKNQVKPT